MFQAADMAGLWQAVVLLNLLLLLTKTRGQEDFYNSDYGDYYHPGESNSSALLYADYGATDGSLLQQTSPLQPVSPFQPGSPLQQVSPLQQASPLDTAVAVQDLASDLFPPAERPIVTGSELPDASPLAPTQGNPDPVPLDSNAALLTNLDSERREGKEGLASGTQPRSASEFVQPGLDSLSEQEFAAEYGDVPLEDFSEGPDEEEVPTRLSSIGQPQDQLVQLDNQLLSSSAAAPRFGDPPINSPINPPNNPPNDPPINPPVPSTKEAGPTRPEDLCLVELGHSNIGKQRVSAVN
jgi:hypothetical protein